MGHQAISRWTCDNCKMVYEKQFSYSEIASEQVYSRPKGWDERGSQFLCPDCIAVRQSAIEIALASRRKETPDAKSE